MCASEGAVVDLEARSKIFGLPLPLPVTLKVRTEYLGLAKRLEIRYVSV